MNWTEQDEQILSILTEKKARIEKQQYRDSVVEELRKTADLIEQNKVNFHFTGVNRKFTNLVSPPPNSKGHLLRSIRLSSWFINGTEQ